MTDVILREELTEQEFNLLLTTLQYAESNAVTAAESARIRKLTEKIVGMSDTPP